MNDSHEFDTPEPTVLVVAVRDGQVVITAADVTTTTVRVTGPRADEARVEQRGGRVLVIGPRHRGFSAATHLRYDITVPTDSQLVVRSGSASLEVTGRLGTTRVKTGSGDVAVDGLSGPGVVDSGSGAISVGDSAGALRLRSGSGRVRVGSSREAVVSTGSGDISVGTLTGKLVAKSGSGDLRVGVASGFAVWTDITTGSGRLTSDLPRMGEPERGAPYVEIRATTGSGDIALTSV
ncbi:DUF4097 family beta strand repeat-containing protein [Nocardioides ultimimeridianus]